MGTIIKYMKIVIFKGIKNNKNGYKCGYVKQ